MAYILREIELCWLNLHWLLVLGVVAADGYSIENHIWLPVIFLTYLLGYFLWYTWPVRWKLDAVIVWCAISEFTWVFRHLNQLQVH